MPSREGVVERGENEERKREDRGAGGGSPSAQDGLVDLAIGLWQKILFIFPGENRVDQLTQEGGGG
jgi:hypothetical protein